MKYKMIVSDFDDTIVDDTQIMSPEFRSAVAEYVAAGGKFVLCTGRMISAIIGYARDLNLKGEVIGYQGSVVADVESGKFLEEESIPGEIAVRVGEYLEERGIYYQIYEDDTFVVQEMTDYSRLYAKFTVKPCIVTGKPLTEYMRGKGLNPTKMLLVSPPELINHHLETLNAAFGEELLINTSKRFILEIIRKGIDKGKAVAKLAAKYGIDREEVICIGDSMNDMPMVSYAGLGVMVANASETAKSVADVIAPACTENGVAYVINKYGLGKDI